MGFSLVAATAGTLAAHALATPITSEAVASAIDKPQYTLTVTAKRLPAECKGQKAESAPSHCLSYLNGDATMEMRANDPD